MSLAGIGYNAPVCVFGGILLLFNLYVALAKEEKYTIPLVWSVDKTWKRKISQVVNEVAGPEEKMKTRNIFCKL